VTLSPRNDRLDQIVLRSATLFDSRGYHQTSMADIAEDVGIKKPTLYHYVTSKEEILFLIHQEFVDLLFAAQERRDATGGQPDELLLGVMTDILSLMRTHRGHVRVFFEHHRELPARYEANITARRDAYFDMICSIITKGNEQGLFNVPDVRLVALAIFGMCNWAYTWYRDDGAMTTEEIGAQFWRWLANGISAQERID
jgi:AcrR family transcriptional regulator